VAQVNLIPYALAPPPFFMALCDGGPPIIERLGALDQGVDPRAQLTVGSMVEINLTITSLEKKMSLDILGSECQF